MSTRQATPPRQNGTANADEAQAEAQALIAAIEHEEAIRLEAEQIRSDASELTPALFLKLRPLLRKPIPSAFIQHVPPVSGKQYDSTGVKSVQVQMDRLDNVLGVQWWGYSRRFEDGGKLCEVSAWIGSDPENPLVRRDSYGGVQNGQPGNLYKGSFTNAAKPAFARLGPAWEVYVGAADYDPDTNLEAAEAQADGGTAPVQADPTRQLPAEKVDPLRKAVEDAGLADHLEMKLRGLGVTSIEGLTVEQALSVYEWAKGESAPEPAPAEKDGES